MVSLQQRLAEGAEDYQLDPAKLDDYAGNLVRKLTKMLQKKKPDSHYVRIEINKLRYLYQAYFEYFKPSKKLAKTLKRSQIELGEWHDNLQWLMLSEHQADQRCCRGYWQREIDQRAHRARKGLKKLRTHLHGNR